MDDRVTLLIDPSTVADRRRIAIGTLQPLAESLRADLAPLISRDLFVPREKARLSRDGGRCRRHGLLLEFDPFDPHHHRCPACGEVHEGEAHYRWWIMSYQLWLAERAVHGAIIGILGGDPAARDLSERIIAAYVEQYLSYPNVDNVLGPTRVFFSTYLESIWLLQLCVAIDLLELETGRSALGDRLRDRVIEPSVRIIESYDEGGSNRQSWNNAAMFAAGMVLGEKDEAESAVWSESGVAWQIDNALLPDGTWFEGENYHLFAHRALWYSVQMAELAGVDLGDRRIARFDAGFGAPFLGVLPDLTLPSRRDSQYAISTRQWRFAELCELGLSRMDDPVLVSTLGRLYAGDVPRRGTGRSSSTAEVERNLPATALSRADLGWRSLLLARETLPPLHVEPPGSVLLEDQGYGVLRRRRGEVYVALDYGHSGGGHGHPDRLNLQLAERGIRWLDDPGTGSYVDPSLHWYRSTLAHNAPLIDLHSQRRVHGELRSFEELGEIGWIDAEVDEISPGVSVRRSVAAMGEYLVDRVEWHADREVTMDLPIHLDGETAGPVSWRAATPEGGRDLEDGFAFLRDTEVTTIPAGAVVALEASRDGRRLRARLAVPVECELWRGVGPGVPGNPPARFHWVRVRGNRTGIIQTVLDWLGEVDTVVVDDRSLRVSCSDRWVDVHQPAADTWHVERRSESETTSFVLAGAARRTVHGTPETVPKRGWLASLFAFPNPTARVRIPAGGLESGTTIALDQDEALEIVLGEAHYRRSEQSWREADAPTARVSIAALEGALVIRVEVAKGTPVFFAPARDRNELDNEHPDINSDGLQLYVAAANDPVGEGWLIVPEDDGRTRVTPIVGGPGGAAASCTWRTAPEGYVVTCSVPLTDEIRRNGVDLDLIVNEMPPGRERRRGQLVLSGGDGEWVYLRGDRQPRGRYMRFGIDAD